MRALYKFVQRVVATGCIELRAFSTRTAAFCEANRAVKIEAAECAEIDKSAWWLRKNLGF